MIREATRRYYLTQLTKAKPLIYWGIWLVIAWILVSNYGHIELLFPIAILFWLLLGFIWWGLSHKWRWWTILIAPILAIITCGPATGLYWGYTNWASEQALDEFIIAVAERDIPAKFDIEADDLARLGDNVAPEYRVEAQDYFFGAYDWWIRFSNGTKYYIVMVQERPGYWEVSAYREP